MNDDGGNDDDLVVDDVIVDDECEDLFDDILSHLVLTIFNRSKTTQFQIVRGPFAQKTEILIGEKGVISIIFISSKKFCFTTPNSQDLNYENS
ncbi:hypothetical protein AC249_AIPGENE4560 [Exaiptasia diaphana]|nr:hypothetical protein AC249_AIPGENE4560 [Exaiptasia diaphana]